jgi:hypothetical protein
MVRVSLALTHLPDIVEAEVPYLASRCRDIRSEGLITAGKTKKSFLSVPAFLHNNNMFCT